MNTTPTTQADFELHLQFAAPAQRIFEALTTAEGVKGWWTLFCDVNTKVGVVKFGARGIARLWAS